MIKNVGDNYRICCSYDIISSNPMVAKWAIPLGLSDGQNFLASCSWDKGCIAALHCFGIPSLAFLSTLMVKALEDQELCLNFKAISRPRTFCGSKSLKLPNHFFLLKSTYIINFRKLPGSQDRVSVHELFFGHAIQFGSPTERMSYL